MRILDGEVDRWLESTAVSNRLGLGAAAALALGIPLFLFVPQIDLAVSKAFFDAGQSAFMGKTPAIEAARTAFKILYFGALAFALAMCVRSSTGGLRLIGVKAAKWLFVCACLSVGPGLVSNVVFKDHWGRARPVQITEFGGQKSFTPAPLPAAQCSSNCAFFSGEASSVYMVFFAAALVFPIFSNGLIAAGLAAGTLTGLIRISQGGHFVSDIYFAGVAMAMTAYLLHTAFRLARNGTRRQVPPESEPLARIPL